MDFVFITSVALLYTGSRCTEHADPSVANSVNLFLGRVARYRLTVVVVACRLVCQTAGRLDGRQVDCYSRVSWTKWNASCGCIAGAVLMSSNGQDTNCSSLPRCLSCRVSRCSSSAHFPLVFRISRPPRFARLTPIPMSTIDLPAIANMSCCRPCPVH